MICDTIGCAREVRFREYHHHRWQSNLHESLIFSQPWVFLRCSRSFSFERFLCFHLDLLFWFLEISNSFRWVLIIELFFRDASSTSIVYSFSFAARVAWVSISRGSGVIKKVRVSF